MRHPNYIVIITGMVKVIANSWEYVRTCLARYEESFFQTLAMYSDVDTCILIVDSYV